MFKRKGHLVNIVGACIHCPITKKYSECSKCGVLICETHLDKSRICELCKSVPLGSPVCFICERPIYYHLDGKYINEETIDIAFGNVLSQREMSSIWVCDECNITRAKPYIKKNNLTSQSRKDVLNYYCIVHDSIYNMLMHGNKMNYAIIKACRAEILEEYDEVVMQFLIPDITAIILEYCQFIRDIVFIPL